MRLLDSVLSTSSPAHDTAQCPPLYPWRGYPHPTHPSEPLTHAASPLRPAAHPHPAAPRLPPDSYGTAATLHSFVSLRTLDGSRGLGASGKTSSHKRRLARRRVHNDDAHSSCVGIAGSILATLTSDERGTLPELFNSSTRK